MDDVKAVREIQQAVAASAGAPDVTGVLLTDASGFSVSTAGKIPPSPSAACFVKAVMDSAMRLPAVARKEGMNGGAERGEGEGTQGPITVELNMEGGTTMVIQPCEAGTVAVTYKPES